MQDFYDLKNGQASIVVTRDEGIVFKLLENEIEEKRSLKLISLNTQYEPYDVPVTEIKEIWKFVCYLNTEIPEPEPDMQKLMKQIEHMQSDIHKLGSKLKS